MSTKGETAPRSLGPPVLRWADARIAVGGSGALVPTFLAGLAGLGAEVLDLGEPADRTAPDLGSLDAAVYLPGATTAGPVPLDALDESEWEAHCAGPMRRALEWCGVVHRHLLERRGTLVFVVPSASLTGAAGLAPHLTAMEGVRALAKSAARQWGPDGIAVHCIAAPLDLVDPALAAGLPPTRWDPALGPTTADDLLELATLLARRSMPALTGATLVADGGIVMAP